MTNRIDLSDLHALEDYRGALSRFGDGADGALTSAEYGAREAEEFCASRVRHWEAEVATAEEAVRRAEQRLAECHTAVSALEADGGIASVNAPTKARYDWLPHRTKTR